VVALNHNASRAWLANYATYIGPIAGYSKQDTITYPMLFDSTGATFDAYQTETALLPSIFLVDQEGKIRLRYDVANEPTAFEEHLAEIIATINELLANPP